MSGVLQALPWIAKTQLGCGKLCKLCRGSHKLNSFRCALRENSVFLRFAHLRALFTKIPNVRLMGMVSVWRNSIVGGGRRTQTVELPLE